MSMGTRAKLNGTEWDAFSRRSRRMLRWAAGELREIKRRFWKKQRASEHHNRILVDREGVAYPTSRPVTLKARKLADANPKIPPQEG
jgi:hypothetical protein